MTPARPTNHSVTEEGVFRSRAFPDFVKRMDELDEVLKGRIALATLERMDESLVKPEELSPREFIKGILQFSRSSPSSRFNYQAINEAAIVLLSACLEGFIENLHAEVMGELLNERTRSQGVLKELVRYAHRRYSNPSPNRIRGLFKICGITGIVSDPREKEINQFVRLRNTIAHGGQIPEPSKDAEDWVKVIRGFADEINSRVENAVNTRRLIV